MADRKVHMVTTSVKTPTAFNEYLSTTAPRYNGHFWLAEGVAVVGRDHCINKPTAKKKWWAQHKTEPLN